MPYKDPKKDLECKLRWQKEHPENFKRYYEKNKGKHLARARKWKEKNRDKYNKWRNAWRRQHRERAYGYSLKKLYGISLEEYKAMLSKQKGKCAICRKPPKGRLHVDHDHKTGRVRGLLCQICNLRVGTLETFGLVKRALVYLGRTL